MYTSKVYVQTDTHNRIVRCEGGYTTPADLTDWICVDEGTGDKYNLCQTHYFPSTLTDDTGAHRYIYAPDLSPAYREATADELTEERVEIEAARVPPPPKQPTDLEIALMQQVVQTRAELARIQIMGGINNV